MENQNTEAAKEIFTQSVKQEYNTHLFIGGVADGMWYSVPTTSQRYCIPVLKTVQKEWISDPSRIPVDVPEIIETYARFKLALHTYPNNDLYVFVHESLYSEFGDRNETIWEIMCKLVKNYKVIR